METRARFILIGLFTLAVIAAGFGFVYWLHYGGGLGAQTAYQIRFEGSTSGLRPGSAVLFNGIRVGEVTSLRLHPERPQEVTAIIAVERNTPIRADTQVQVYAQGLMGAPSIALQGGSPTAPAIASDPGALPLLVAAPDAGQDVMQVARDVLRRVDTVVSENAEPLRSTIENLNTFAAALARNSERLDKIAAGLERMVGGEPEAAPPTVYDLTAPRAFPPIDAMPEAQLGVAEPTAILLLDTQRVLLRKADGAADWFAEAQWSESLPHLFQARIIQSFENAGYLRADRALTITGDHQLSIDIRAFRLSLTPDPVAEIEFGAKLLDDGGQVVDGRVFSAAVPATAADAPAAVAALDAAFGQAVTELVAWVLDAL